MVWDVPTKVNLIVLKKRGELLDVCCNGLFLVIFLGKIWSIHDSEVSLAVMLLFR